MALSWEETSGTAGQTTVPVNVAYLDKADIHLEINDTEISGFTWASDVLINIPTTVTIAAGDKIAVIRKTDRSVLRLLFSEGAEFTRSNIDEQNDQFLYLAQELVEGRSIDGFYGDISMNGYRITALGDPEEGTDAANKNYVDITVSDASAKTVRFSSRSINPMPDNMAHKFLAFDADNQPLGVTMQSGSSTELALALAESTGAELIGTAEGDTLAEYLAKREPVATNPLFDSWGTVAKEFKAGDYELKILGDDAGRLKTAAYQNGMLTGYGAMFPISENTGRMITTTYGVFPEKLVYFPSNGYETEFTSPALGFTYNSAGLPKLSVISPARYRAGNSGWPDAGTATQNVLVSDLATTADIANQLTYARVALNTSQQYVQVARWKVNAEQYNTELKLNITSSNTTDNFLGTVVVECNVQSSKTTLATVANITQQNLTKYIKARFDGPRERVPLNSATVATIPRLACTGDGTYLYLWLIIPAGQSSVTLSTVMQGTGTGLTSYISSLSPTTTAPSGMVYVPMQVDYNGTNSSVSNSGQVISADAHVRICSTSGTSSRTDITRDGFIWGGYGTFKSFREGCTISRKSTGVYSVVGIHQSYDWQLSQPVDLNGEQSAIARVTAVSSDGYTIEVSVYAIKYTYDSTTSTVTRGIGDLMDIPTNTWVDLKGSITF